MILQSRLLLLLTICLNFAFSGMIWPNHRIKLYSANLQTIIQTIRFHLASSCLLDHMDWVINNALVLNSLHLLSLYIYWSNSCLYYSKLSWSIRATSSIYYSGVKRTAFSIFTNGSNFVLLVGFNVQVLRLFSRCQ